MERRANALIQRVLDIPRILRDILTRPTDLRRQYMRNGLIRDVEYCDVARSSTRLQYNHPGERPRKRTRLVYEEEDQRENFFDGLQNRQSTSPNSQVVSGVSAVLSTASATSGTPADVPSGYQDCGVQVALDDWTGETEADSRYTDLNRHQEASQCCPLNSDQYERSSTVDGDYLKDDQEGNRPKAQLTGSFRQPTIFLTEDLSSRIHDAGKAARAIKEQEWLLQEAERAVHMAEAQVSIFHNALQSTIDTEESAKLQEAGDRQYQTLEKASGRRDAIKANFEMLTRNEVFYKAQLQQLLEQTLEEAGLLHSSSLKPDAVRLQHQGSNDGYDDERSSVTSLNSGCTALSTSELLRRTAYDDLDKAQQAREKAEDDFENRADIYLEQLARYEDAFEAGNIDMSRSTFDGHMYNHTRGLTRALIDAEELEQEAIGRAVALGIDTFDRFDLGPENRDHQGIGYSVSGEMAMALQLDQDRVYRWLDDVPAEFSESAQAPCGEPDDGLWEAKSAGISDAASAIDVDEYVDKISSWEKHCSVLRDHRLAKSQGESIEVK